MRTRKSFGTGLFGKFLAIFGIANVRECGTGIFVHIFLSDWGVAISTFEHSSSGLELFTAHSQMVGSRLALFTLLSFAVGPGAIESLFGVENCILGLDGLSSFVFFGGVIRVSRCKIVLRPTLDTFDDVEVVDFSHDFVL